MTCCAVQVQGLALRFERAEAAAKLEAEVAVEEAQTQLQAAHLAQQQLQQQLDMREQQTEARLAAAADALTAATAEIEQLSMQLLQAQRDLEQQREQRQPDEVCVCGQCCYPNIRVVLRIQLVSAAELTHIPDARAKCCAWLVSHAGDATPTRGTAG